MTAPAAVLDDLTIEVDAIQLEPLVLETASGWWRRTTVVRLEGGGASGAGEDVTYDAEAQDLLQAAGAAPFRGLVGRWSWHDFSRRAGELDLGAPSKRDPHSPKYRRWAVESAGLALALRQRGCDLAALFGREAGAVRYALSLGLGDPPSTAPLEEILREYPGARFKIDLARDWSRATVAALAELDRVDVVDLKGLYRGDFAGPPADVDQYRWVAELLPGCWIEDPELNADTRAALAAHLDRVTWDAAIHSFEDLRDLEREPRCINVKPSRSGTVTELLAIVEHCERRGIAMYGGGQFELGPGRRQIQALASVFYPDGPNDVAPVGFHVRPVARDLASSPLPPPRFA